MAIGPGFPLVGVRLIVLAVVAISSAIWANRRRRS